MKYRNYAQKESFADFPTEAGKPEIQQYRKVTDDYGVTNLVPYGKPLNAQEIINSARPPLVNELLERAKRGDLMALNQMTGEVLDGSVVGDLTNKSIDDLYDQGKLFAERASAYESIKASKVASTASEPILGGDPA